MHKKMTLCRCEACFCGKRVALPPFSLYRLGAVNRALACGGVSGILLESASFAILKRLFA